MSPESGAPADQVEETPGRASLEKLGCRTPPQLHAGGVGRQQQQESCDVFNRSRSEMLQVEALLFLQLLFAFINRSAVNVCAISNGFLLVSLVTIRVSLEEVCLPSFEVLIDGWLNLVASCLDDDNELPLKVIASFSAVRMALPSIPLIVIHSLIRSVFWSMVGEVGSLLQRSSSLFTYLCWYMFLMGSVASSRDVVCCCFELLLSTHTSMLVWRCPSIL